MRLQWLVNIMLLVSCCLTSVQADDDDEKNVPQEKGTVKVSYKAQQLSGIETVTLTLAQHHAEFVAYGKALSVQPLLELRSRYFAALTAQRQVKARLQQAEQGMMRQEELYRSGVGAKRNLQEQQVQWQTDQAQLTATNIQEQAIVNEARLTWGEILAEWVLENGTTPLNAFLAGSKTLLQITLPSNKSLKNQQSIVVESTGNRSTAQIAQFIARAPQTDGNQGVNYFFQTSGKNMPVGSNVTAWLSDNGIQSGVIIPKTALIWSMAQAIAYVKSNDGQFNRRVITDYSPIAEGYFVNDGLKSGEQVVTMGTQLLLSEELREQISQEEDD